MQPTALRAAADAIRSAEKAEPINNSVKSENLLSLDRISCGPRSIARGPLWQSPGPGTEFADVGRGGYPEYHALLSPAMGGIFRQEA